MAEDTAPLNYLNFPIPSLNVLPLLIIEEDTDNKAVKVIQKNREQGVENGMTLVLAPVSSSTPAPVHLYKMDVLVLVRSRGGLCPIVHPWQQRGGMGGGQTDWRSRSPSNMSDHLSTPRGK